MTGFRRSTDAEPDLIDLELHLLGARGATADDARIEAAARGPLAERRAEIEHFEAWWSDHRPPLALPSPRRRAEPAVWASGLLLAAAGVATVVGLATGPGPALAPEGAHTEVAARPMGTALQIRATRGGRPLPTGAELAPGDQLHILLTAPTEGFVSVTTVQQDGHVSTLRTGVGVRSGTRFSLDGAARLDDYAGREWLVVQIDRVRPTGEQLHQAVNALLPEPATHADETRWIHEITRGPR